MVDCATINIACSEADMGNADCRYCIYITDEGEVRYASKIEPIKQLFDENWMSTACSIVKDKFMKANSFQHLMEKRLRLTYKHER